MVNDVELVEHLNAVNSHCIEVKAASQDIRSVKVPAMVSAMAGDIKGPLNQAADMLDRQSELLYSQAVLLAKIARERE